MKRLISALALLVLAGCAPTDEKPKPPKKPVLLTEHEGCWLYMFDAEWHRVYYVRCADKEPAQTQFQYSCGKGCSRPVLVTTFEETA